MVDESYETEYWIQLKTKRGSKDGYSSDGRIKLTLFKCNQDNDWALLYRVSGTFNTTEIVLIGTTALNMGEDEYFDEIRGKDATVVYCPVRHIQNTIYANEFTLVAFQSQVKIQSASLRHVYYSGHGSSGGGVIVNGRLVAMNQDRIDDDVDEEEEALPKEFCDKDGNPLPVHKVESSVSTLSEDKTCRAAIKVGDLPVTKKLKSDSETAASRPVSTASLSSAIILCRCSKLMEHVEKIESGIALAV